MASAPLGKRPHEPPLRLGSRQLACLQRWMSAAAQEHLAVEANRVAGPALVPVAPGDRRGALRRQLETTATLRPISPGGPGGVREASVVDVSRDGIALRLAESLGSGQSISLQINPPGGLGAVSPTRPAGGGRRAPGEAPVRILAVVRYCRSEADSYVLGCSFGADWAASLASEMLPPDLPALRQSA